jgi:hypothetical protein
MFAESLGYFPAPKYIEEELREYPHYYKRDAFGTFFSARGQYRPLKLNYRKIQNLGKLSRTTLDATAAITRSDTTGDGVSDRFTITILGVSSTLDVASVAVYFTEADRNGLPLEEWQIKPIRATLSGTTLTIIGESYLLVSPDAQLRLDPTSLSATAAGTYVTTAEVYSETNDPSDAGSLQWEIPNCDELPCQVEVHTGCFGLRDRELGWVTPQPATWDATDSRFEKLQLTLNRAPDRVNVNYVSGTPRESSGKMNRRNARIIALLATVLLPNKATGCDRANQRLLYYREPPKDADGNLIALQEETRWGINRGAIMAVRMLGEERYSFINAGT